MVEHPAGATAAFGASLARRREPEVTSYDTLTEIEWDRVNQVWNLLDDGLGWGGEAAARNP